jgi:hypothetical protein
LNYIVIRRGDDGIQRKPQRRRRRETTMAAAASVFVRVVFVRAKSVARGERRTECA